MDVWSRLALVAACWVVGNLMGWALTRRKGDPFNWRIIWLPAYITYRKKYRRQMRNKEES